MIRFVATMFNSAVIATVFAVLGIAGVVEIYGRGLPDGEQLSAYSPRLLSRVYSAEGAVIAEYATERRIFVPIEEVPPLVKHAFISAEDKNFYDHPGVDVTGIAKAVGRFAISRAQGQTGRIAGASTITQQVMKNFLVGNERSIERKIREMILAVRIDGALTKDQILELYLNEIFLGARAYGIVAAARIYFDKRLDELDAGEAAYLAALPQRPSVLHPVRNRGEAEGRRDYVLREMAENGYITRAEARAFQDQPLRTVLEDDREVETIQNAGLGYFTTEVRRQVTGELGRDELYEGGLSVRATVDPRLQALAARALRRGLVSYDRSQGVWRGPLATIEPGEDWAAALAEVAVPRNIGDWRPAVVLSVEGEAATIGVEGLAEPARLELNGERWIRAREIDGQRLGAPRAARDLWTPGDVVYVAPDGEAEDGSIADWDMQQPPEVQGAFMAMDPETGRVLAIQGGFSFEQSVFNRATQALRQPGSAFKPFVYAVALDAGYTPATIVNDAPVAVRLSNGETWRPKNSSGNAYGPTPMRRGLELSRNLMTVRIA
ncbi:MAG: transglycosylase domain-containing protein, partial [Pseudomonadota bacterium]